MTAIQQPVKECVVIVDSDEAALTASKEIFAQMGYDVLSYTDPNKALRSLEQKKFNWKPSVVVTDVILSQMSGFELMRRFESRFNKTEIILAMTSKYSQPEDALEASQAGAFGLIKKPLEPAKVKALIERFKLQKLKSQIGSEVFQIGYD